jgi:hypothetical protein
MVKKNKPMEAHAIVDTAKDGQNPCPDPSAQPKQVE